jgi:hypothetical protein
MGDQQPYVRDGRSRWKRPLIIASIVVASALLISFGTVVVFTAVTIVSAFHPFASSAADARIKPFDAALEKEGGKKLCSNGDAGYGPDNLVPWSTAYYLVPHAGSVSGALKRTAAAEGYPLTPMVFEDNPDPTPDEALRSGDRVEISIYRDTDVPLDCDNNVDHYGQKRHLSGDDAIVELTIQLPSRSID